MNENLLEELYRIVGQDGVLVDEPMSKHTTFKIGGPALIICPRSTEELEQVLASCNAFKETVFILGHGSNMLVSDKGIEEPVIHLGNNFASFKIIGDRIEAQAGVMLSKLGNAAKDAGLAGFEFATGIPGTLGGAVMMNAGAYGGEMKDVIESVSLLTKDGKFLKKTCEEMDFSYRHSIVSELDAIVIGAVIKLCPGDKAEIAAKIDELAEKRRDKQPLEFPSAGSTFKRPEGYFAGKLIEDAGLRGFTVGGAKVSDKHCGFVINAGGATAEDVKELMRSVSDKVYEKFGVRMEPEVRIVGRQ